MSNTLACTFNVIYSISVNEVSVNAAPPRAAAMMRLLRSSVAARFVGCVREATGTGYAHQTL